MLSYFDVFPEKAKTELRNARFVEEGLPDGAFLFTEHFCTDLDCDCQRVLVKVLHVTSKNARARDVATISYTWNDNPDREWLAVTGDMPNPFLDPLNPQASYAPQLLDFWTEMIESDPAYVARLQRHYHELRAACGERPPRAMKSSRELGNLRTHVPTKHERRARQRMLERAKRHRKPPR